MIRWADEPMSQWADCLAPRSHQLCRHRTPFIPCWGGEPHSPPSMHWGGCFVWLRRTGTFLAGAGRWLLLLLLWQCQDTSLNTASTACHTARCTVRYTARCTAHYTARCTACYTAHYTARRSALKKAIVNRALAINRRVLVFLVVNCLEKYKCIDSYVALSGQGAHLNLSLETFYLAGSKPLPKMVEE